MSGRGHWSEVKEVRHRGGFAAGGGRTGVQMVGKLESERRAKLREQRLCEFVAEQLRYASLLRCGLEQKREVGGGGAVEDGGCHS